MSGDTERNDKTISRLYEGLAEHDGEKMASCYAPDATFSDPVFPELTGEQVGDMWRMLTSRATDLELEVPESKATDEGGVARWIASYTFRATGRKVTNRVRSDFRFDESGLIVEQHDDFPFWKWSRQALGVPGILLGWTIRLRTKVRSSAATELGRFRAERESGAEPAD